jgi:protein involved in polysaccharide export with SLBB domain
MLRPLKYVPFLLLVVAATTAQCGQQASPTGEGASQASTPVVKVQPVYLIQVGDQLDIKLFYNSELNEQVTVRPDGRITLQLANDVVAAGLTPEQLRDTLVRIYSTRLKNPELSVIVRSFSSQRLFVDGEVGHPGMLTMVGPTRLLDAISEAGGVKVTARTQEVLIIRRGGPKPEVMKVNMKHLLQAKYVDQDVMLMPYDVVYVPKSHIANVNQFVDQYITKNIPVTFGIYSNPF